jgi:hypothetical protein
MRGAYRVLMGNLKEGDHLGESGLYWEDDIKMDL